ncbi:hypothetical protein ABZ778_26555 [Streptomyces bacillaris]|uniref:hypothetical protein n=1 Tax=Streptomyces bacillaris TaxID=68179 RepID=UPI00346072A3
MAERPGGRPNASGVVPVTARVDSGGLWVHTATKYLRQAAVAGPLVEALAAGPLVEAFEK